MAQTEASDPFFKQKLLLEKQLQQLKNGGTESARTAPSPVVKSHLKVKKRTTPYKSVLCLFLKEGRCRKGQYCVYAHGESELRPAPGAGISPNTNALPATPAGAPGLPQQGVWGAMDAATGFPQDAAASIFAPGAAPDFAAGLDANALAAMQMQQAMLAGMEPGADAGTAALTAALSGAGLSQATLSALAGNGPEAAAAIAAAATAAQQYQSLLLLNSMGGAGAGAGGALPEDRGPPLDLSTSSTRKNFKMQMCRFFQEGKCHKGTMCPYAHGQDEMAAAAVRAARVEATLQAAMKEGSRNDVCYDFRDRGKCRFGITCKFSHNLEIPDPSVRGSGLHLS